MMQAVSVAALCRINAAAASLPALDSLVAYWKMDEVGSVPRLDSSGNAHTLAVTGTVNSGVGKINNGSAFVNNSANFLSCADAVFAGVFPFTAFAWVNITGSLGNNQTVLAHFSAVPPSGWRILLDGTQFFRLETGDGLGGGQIIGNAAVGPIGTGTYHLIIASMIDATHATLKVDNALEANANPGIISNPAGSFKVGVSDAIPSQLDGIVDEVGIYNRLLTSAEKDALWNAGAGKQYPFT
jgi:hypothetical protein